MAVNGIGGYTTGSANFSRAATYTGTGSLRDEWENRNPLEDEDDEEVGGSSGSSQIWDAVFTDKKENSVSVDDFLSLMVAQMTNQDFMNPMDDTQFVTQLAQFSSMQMMQEMANYTKTSYVMSLVGKPVTAARISVGGELLKETGPVQKISLHNNEYAVWVNGKKFSLEQIMELGTTDETTGSDGTNKPGSSTEDDSYRKNYLLSLIGKTDTVTKKTSGEGDSTVSIEVPGKVEKVSSKDNNYRVYVNGEWYSLDNVTEIAGENTDTNTDTDTDTDTDSGNTEKPPEEAEEV